MKKISFVLVVCFVVFNLCGCFSSVKKVLFISEVKKAKITVADFEVKTAKADKEAVLALREKLISALLKSNRFLISEPALKQADLILTVTLVEFEPQGQSGGRLGIGGGGGLASGEFGGLLGPSINKAHVALEIRIADYANSQVFSVGNVQAQASENFSLDKAINECVNEAVRYIVQSIPSKYYKY
jgi:curli biogenesis system outer membrane secretion channel CsgG